MAQTFATPYEKLFFDALRIRVVEEKIAELYPSDKIQSPVHLSIGQEPVAVGLCARLNKDDLVFGNYRGHAVYLAKGGSLNRMLAELYGKATGCGGGKAGSMHLSEKSVGVMGASAIVASTIPHAVGAALAAKVRGTKQVIVAMYGDGATGEGVYHESLNFASLHKLPVLFLCENNELAIFNYFQDLHAYDLTKHAAAYEIPASKLAEGWDLEKTANGLGKLIDEIREGGGPRMVEVTTYRYRQHVGPKEDHDMDYRDHAIYENWKKKDPLIQNAKLVEKFLPAIEAEWKEAVAFAESSPFPGEDALLANVR